MTSAQELELMRTISQIRKELRELKNLVNPLVPKRDEYLDFKEAQAFLKFSRSKMFKLMSEGTIPFAKVENRLRFSRNALIQWMQQQ